jgi:adenylate cyclase
MTSRDGDNAPRRLAFGRFVLDLDRGNLCSHGREIPLRPKTFAVLVHLATHPDRLVSKEELFASVWPDLVVTDDTLVQSIGELRRALGDADARLITTVPRRGYRFESAAAPGERRRAPGLHVLRFKWIYGLLAPLAVTLALVAVWFATGREPASVDVVDSRPSIAVLPFSGAENASREYFTDGLTQDVIHSLGRFSALTVMSWNAVAAYKGTTARPDEIARALGVRYQVEGSVRLAGERLRVAAQLVDAGGRVLWSRSFDETPDDVFALEERIAREIVGALAIRVTELEQRRVAVKPGKFDAYELVLRARPALQHPTRAGIVEARALLREAIALDPRYAAAHSALGETFHVAISMGWAESPEDYWGRVTAAANAALALDPDDMRAHILLGRHEIAYNRYANARMHIDRAIAINPNDADALAGRGNILVWLGVTDDAIAALEHAQRIDPGINAFDRFALSLAYYVKGRYEDCIAQAERNLAKDGDARFNRALLAAANAQLGRSEEAARLAAEVRRTDPTFDGAEFGNKFLNPESLARLREGLGKAGLYSPARLPAGA